MENEYLPQKVKILEKKKQTEDTFSFKLDWAPEYMPGQITEISLPLIGEAPFGFASYGKKYTEFLIRDVGNVTQRFIKEEKTFFIRGPYGHGFPLEKMEGKNIILVAGGTGIVPIKACIEYIIKNRKKYADVDLFLGFRSLDQKIFGEYFDEWEKHITLHICLDKSEKDWKGPVGFVTDLLKKHKYKENSIGISCGPPIMMSSASKIFIQNNISEEDIYLSLERNMHCGIGKCGHCMVKKILVCKDGPIFPYSIAKTLED